MLWYNTTKRLFCEKYVLHFGTLPQYVPDLAMKLPNWFENSDVHMLIRRWVFHYELELIHPFADENGRVMSCAVVILPLHSRLPAEPIIHVLCGHHCF